MKITSIEKKSGSRYTVEVDGEYFYILDLEILQDNQVKVGLEVEEAFLADLKYQAEKRRARERAFYLLSYRDHSEKELYDKLCKNVSEEVAAETVAKMIDMHLLDDAVYAKKLAEYYLKEKLWSYRKSVYELCRKGIAKSVAEEALSACAMDPLEQITELLDRKYARMLQNPQNKQKVINALARLGFQYGDIKTAISEYGIEEEDEEWQYE